MVNYCSSNPCAPAAIHGLTVRSVIGCAYSNGCCDGRDRAMGCDCAMDAVNPLQQCDVAVTAMWMIGRVQGRSGLLWLIATVGA